MRNLPNILTLARIISAPVIALLLLSETDKLTILALILFLIAAITDFLDGWLARRLKADSSLGAVLDPIGDKLIVCLVLPVLVAFYVPSKLHFIAVIIIIFRELLISGLREALADYKVKLPVTTLAKWKTFLQLGAIGTLMAAHTPLVVFDYFSLEIIGTVLLWLATILAFWTGYIYVVQALKSLQKPAS